MASIMARETAEAPAAVARFLDANAAALAAVGRRLRNRPPPVVVTCARGSSDHAATYGKYLIETLTGVPVASAAPSVASLYQATPAIAGGLVIAVSQSGRSPDLLAAIGAYRRAGAEVIALVNDEQSPLAAAADTLLALKAGPELAVAATKTCLASFAGLAALTAAWSDDAALSGAVARLPEVLDTALSLDWSGAIAPLLSASGMFVLARGYGLGVAQEAALKLKETCAIQAEPFSAAEVRHGPMRIVEPGFPVLGFAPGDPSGADVAGVGHELASRGAALLLAGQGGALPVVAAGHRALDPLPMLASFYRLVEAVARGRGMNPDAPPHLAKITETL